MFDIIDFNEWDIADNAPFGSGRSEKYWIENQIENVRGIFKFPKITDFDTITGEYWAEKLASEIGKIIGIDIAEVDLGIFQNRKGSMSYFIPKENESLLEVVHFIAINNPEYNVDSLYDKDSEKYYSLEMLESALGEYPFFKNILETIIFDALIGNADRHHSNWGIIVDDKLVVRFCPLYDNGSSLCCYEEHNIQLILNDDMKFNALVNTKSKSIFLNENGKRIRHTELVETLSAKYYNETIDLVKRISNKITTETLQIILDEFDDDIIATEYKKVIIKFLLWKKDMIIGIYEKRC